MSTFATSRFQFSHQTPRLQNRETALPGSQSVPLTQVDPELAWRAFLGLAQSRLRTGTFGSPWDGTRSLVGEWNVAFIDRGLTAADVAALGLGIYPDRDEVRSYLLSVGFSERAIELSGLLEEVIDADGEAGGRAGCLVCPLYDRFGDLVDLGLMDLEAFRQGSREITFLRGSQETGMSIYAVPVGGPGEHVYLTESILEALMMHRAGVSETAALGESLSRMQSRTWESLADLGVTRVTLMIQSGDPASVRHCLDQARSSRYCPAISVVEIDALTDQQTPAHWIREHGAGEWRQRVDEAAYDPFQPARNPSHEASPAAQAGDDQSAAASFWRAVDAGLEDLWAGATQRLASSAPSPFATATASRTEQVRRTASSGRESLAVIQAESRTDCHHPAALRLLNELAAGTPEVIVVTDLDRAEFLVWLIGCELGMTTAAERTEIRRILTDDWSRVRQPTFARKIDAVVSRLSTLGDRFRVVPHISQPTGQPLRPSQAPRQDRLRVIIDGGHRDFAAMSVRLDEWSRQLHGEIDVVWYSIGGIL